MQHKLKLPDDISISFADTAEFLLLAEKTMAYLHDH